MTSKYECMIREQRLKKHAQNENRFSLATFASTTHTQLVLTRHRNHDAIRYLKWWLQEEQNCANPGGGETRAEVRKYFHRSFTVQIIYIPLYYYTSPVPEI